MDAVLAPWTDVVAEFGELGVEVDVWGRTYLFANEPLPTSIMTADREVLTSPVRLVGIAEGKPIVWENHGSLLFRHDKTQATVSGWQASETLIINTTSQIMFDGMMRVDLVVVPKRGTTPKLEKLWLEIPLKKEQAALYHYWPGRWGSAANSGAVPQAGLTLPFKPFVWIGWEDGGLSWFSESDKGWQPEEDNRHIEIVTHNDCVILRLRLLDSAPPTLPLTFTFGFQATPVKPIPDDFHEWRICHGARYGMENQPVKAGESETILDRMAELGVKTLIYHEQWTPIQDYWLTTKEDELKSLVSACHKRGIKLLLYFGYELSTLTPEWGEVHDKVLVKSTQGGLSGGYYRQPEQRDYIVCYNSEWQDRFVAGVAEALDRYGFDGVYLDGTIEPWGCANEKHECGYRSPDGSLHLSYPVFAVRNLMKRLYEEIHPRGGLINAHQSTCCVTPVLAYCHSYWDGEQFQGGQLGEGALEKLPLEAFRAEFMGKNFGVPCEFLVYEKPPNWTFDHALAFTLLHDVRVRPGGFGKKLDQMSEIWAAMTDFGVSEAKWYPYWSNAEFVKADPISAKVSFYVNKGQALLVVSNLSTEKDVEGQVTLNRNALGLSGAFESAHDAITGEEIVLQGDGLKLNLPAMRARIIRIQ